MWLLHDPCVMYHGTAGMLAADIECNGLVPRAPRRVCFVTPDRQRAESYAAWWTAHFLEDHGGDDVGAIVSALVNHDDVSPDCGMPDHQFIVDRIPPERVTVERFTVPPNQLYPPEVPLPVIGLLCPKCAP